MTPATSSSTIFPSIWFRAESFVANGTPSFLSIVLGNIPRLRQASGFSASVSNRLELTINQANLCEFYKLELHHQVDAEIVEYRPCGLTYDFSLAAIPIHILPIRIKSI